jgi:hypothetical protein
MSQLRLTPSTQSPRRMPPCPPAEFLRTGTLPPNAPHFVRYVDEDAEGGLRLVELAPDSPSSRKCA